MNKDIDTTIIDGIMKELGWKKYRETYVFYRKTGKEPYAYYISFPTDVYSMYLMYQEAYDNKKITKEELKNQLKKIFSNVTLNTYSKKEQLKWGLAMLAADYYWHNNNKLLHKKYVDLYEKLTGKEY